MKAAWKRKAIGGFAALLAVSTVAACSSDNNKSGSSPSASPDASPSASAAPEQPKLEKLTYFVELNSGVAATRKSYGELPIFEEMEKRTGVKVDFQHPPTGKDQTKQALNLMVASNQLTDVIEFNWAAYAGGPEKALSDGVIIDLKPIIEEHAPNLKKLIDENPELRKAMTTDSGKMFAFPEMTIDPKQMTFYGPGIRKDWLDKLGLEVPTTIDEWYTVLKAFKEKDPNGNGQADEIPILMDMNNSSKLQLSHAFIGAYGIGMKYFNEGGTVKYGAMEPAYKDFLMEMNKWYKEGLLDPEFATPDKKIDDAKMANNLQGAGIFLPGGGIGTYNQLIQAKDPNALLVGAPYPTLVKGEVAKFKHVGSMVGNGVAISSSNPNPIETAKWLDYRYGEEGNLLMNFGIEGVTYNMVDGYPTYTDEILKNPDGLGAAQALGKYVGYTARITDIRYSEQYSWTTQAQKDAVKLWSEPDGSRSIAQGVLSFPEEESTKFASINNDLNTFVEEMTNKFIMGAESFDNFDKFVSQLKALGVEDAIRMEQAALDRYNKR